MCVWIPTHSYPPAAVQSMHPNAPHPSPSEPHPRPRAVLSCANFARPPPWAPPPPVASSYNPATRNKPNMRNAEKKEDKWWVLDARVAILALTSTTSRTPFSADVTAERERENWNVISSVLRKACGDFD
ncbi:hypothetical protein B0A49_11623 [Cryomyces minteri]|uniref:Uncharacterized protein n=1 Tax=Cryomyces minteri TaxID=331657 RepID=A0A4U0VZ65_9PEZI|nr:hypothetical protein B0A49_11623 [Cryomyces minteri]